MLKRIGLVIGLLLLALVAYLGAAYHGALGQLESPGEISQVRRPAEQVSRDAAVQSIAAAGIGAAPGKQILFGDLHVHTTFSMDAFLTSLPIMQGEGAHPPADACDFARHCSALDFYSINDHAEGLTADKWAEIRESVRQCNAVAGSESSPDMVAFLGWEWTQMSSSAEDHYGHKNVVLRDIEDDRTPTRPIASLGTTYQAMRAPQANRMMPALALRKPAERQRYWDLMALGNTVVDMPLCESGVPVRDLPADCSEAVATPRELFAKLDEWGYPSMVIPHGNAWGNTTPAGIEWEKQLANGQHDPDRQTLIEIYSGHGNSEEYRPWRHVAADGEGGLVCPEPSGGFVPECWRAGEIVGARCGAAGLEASECDARAATARRRHVAAGRVGTLVVPGETAEDWLDSGQCTDCFEPAFQLRPGGSTQNALAVSGVGVAGAPQDPDWRFRFGIIASSDNHTARPSTGYKEFRALGMTDALHRDGSETLRSLLPVDREVRPESIEIDPAKVPMVPGGDERLTSFFYTGGLVAVHSEGRSREAIWQALQRREVYGTSGPRILLWFELQNGPGGEVLPMGGETAMNETPRFRVRALGSRRQLPGCPESAASALSKERLEALCMGECDNPGDTRRIIERIDIVRIRPRISRGEDVAGLVEDAWKSFACAPDEGGCVVEFEDADFVTSGRDSVYYARVIEEPSEQVNGDPLRCERDEAGVCISTEPCRPGDAADSDQCLGVARARAWSSPIFVDQG
jgi:hypothetical protein